MKAKIISTLTYPAIVICVAVIVFIIIMVVAVPAFTSVFLELGTELPGITKGSSQRRIFSRTTGGRLFF